MIILLEFKEGHWSIIITKQKEFDFITSLKNHERFI